jgi:hypothetical protein
MPHATSDRAKGPRIGINKSASVYECIHFTWLNNAHLGQLRRRWVGGIGPNSLVRVGDVSLMCFLWMAYLGSDPAHSHTTMRLLESFAHCTAAKQECNRGLTYPMTSEMSVSRRVEFPRELIVRFDSTDYQREGLQRVRKTLGLYLLSCSFKNGT